MLDIPSTAHRVLNVLKQWVEKHYYDFEASPQLLRDLKAFVYGLFRFAMAHVLNVDKYE